MSEIPLGFDPTCRPAEQLTDIAPAALGVVMMAAGAMMLVSTLGDSRHLAERNGVRIRGAWLIAAGFAITAADLADLCDFGISFG